MWRFQCYYCYSFFYCYLYFYSFIVRWRKEIKPPSPLSQADIQLEGPWSRTKSGEGIIKGDTPGEHSEDRCVTMSSKPLLKAFSESPRVNVDCTFKVEIISAKNLQLSYFLFSSVFLSLLRPPPPQSAPLPNYAALLITFSLLFGVFWAPTSYTLMPNCGEE